MKSDLIMWIFEYFIWLLFMAMLVALFINAIKKMQK